MILEFTLAEERVTKALMEDFQAAVYIVAPAMRRGIACGVERAIAAVEVLPVDVRQCQTLTAEQAWYAAQQQCLDAMRAITAA